MRDYVAPGVFFLVAIYIAWIAASNSPLWYLLWAVLFCVAAMGLILHRGWASYLALSLCGLNIAAWFALTISLDASGWLFPDRPTTIEVLIPGLLWVSMWAVVAVLLSRRLRHRS